MTIYAVFIRPHAGTENDQKQAQVLELRKKYKLRTAIVGCFHSTVYLEGFEEWFNSVHFSFIDEHNNEVNIYKLPVFSTYSNFKKEYRSISLPETNIRDKEQNSPSQEPPTTANDNEMNRFEALVVSLVTHLYDKQVLFKQNDHTWYNRHLGMYQNIDEMIKWSKKELLDSVCVRTF